MPRCESGSRRAPISRPRGYAEGRVPAWAGRDLDGNGAGRGRHRLGRGPLFHVARFGQLLLALDLAAVVLGHGQRQLPWQEVVARVPGRDLDDVAAGAQVFDVLSEYDFHVAS